MVVTCCANVVAGGQAWTCFERVSNKNGQSNFDGSVPLGYSQFSTFSVRRILISRLLSVRVGRPTGLHPTAPWCCGAAARLSASFVCEQFVQQSR